MKLKRIIAFTLAAVLMVSSMTVLAADFAPNGDGKYATDGTSNPGENVFTGANKPVAGSSGNCADENLIFAAGDVWKDSGNSNKEYEWKNNDWVEKTTTPSTPPDEGGDGGNTSSGDSSSSGSCGGSSSVEAPAPVVVATDVEVEAPKSLTVADIMAVVVHAETVALQNTAKEEGFADMVQMQEAAAKNMSAGEYYNNAVVETPGIEEATPVAQGGGIIIDGVATNVMATISKVDVAFVDSVRASVEGTVLNVVDVKFPAVAATINFYMPGVAADANIIAVQYIDGVWTEVEVAEVRADHVVLNLKQNGKVAFLAK